MAALRLIRHPLIERDLTILRDRATPTPVFRTVLRRISLVMAFEVTRDLRCETHRIRTPLEGMTGKRLADDVVLVHGRFHARGAASGIELDVETYAVYRVEGEVAVRIENWRHREDAERSSGLRLSS